MHNCHDSYHHVTFIDDDMTFIDDYVTFTNDGSLIIDSLLTTYLWLHFIPDHKVASHVHCSVEISVSIA